MITLIPPTLSISAPLVPSPKPPAAPEPLASKDSLEIKGVKFSRQETNFGGAYYRKITSSASPQWGGIQLEGILPNVAMDPQRGSYGGDKNDSSGDYTAGPLDRPSVYTGGHGDGNREVDCGLTWDRVWNAPQQGTYTGALDSSDGRNAADRFFQDTRGGQPVVIDGEGKVRAQGAADSAAFLADKKMNFAFRPYIRDSAGHWITPQPPGSANDRYFYPGEAIKMSLKSIDKGQLQLEIDLVGSNYTYKQNFPQEGFGPGTSPSYKRVNSIDQFRLLSGPRRTGNEGNPVIPTSTVLSNNQWTKAVMLTRSGAEVPMVGANFSEIAGSDLYARYDKVFQVTPTTPQGGEVLQIDPQAV